MIGVSCLCPTFGRPVAEQWLLEEAIQSFLLQSFPGPAELVILNDHPLQHLKLEFNCGKKVRIINECERYKTLGDKYNAMVNYANYDFLMPWEDDDISLPDRILQAVKCIGMPPFAIHTWNGEYLEATAQAGPLSYWKPPQVWYMLHQPPFSRDSFELHWRHPVGVRHHAGIFTRQAWADAGGYPSTSGNQDSIFDFKLRLRPSSALPIFPDGLPPSEWQYIYRGGVSRLHLAGTQKPEQAYRDYPASHSHALGSFVLQPHWRHNYVELVQVGAQV